LPPRRGGTRYMPGIIVQSRAIKIVNRGGGRKCKTVRLGNGRHTTYVSDKQPGTDYIVWNCRACGKRNKRSAYDIRGASGEAVAIKCNGCLIENEVFKPTSTPIILDPNSPAQVPSGLVGPDGKPLRRI
jgi:hypothetical protein